MTNEQKYNNLILELSELIDSKNTKIILLEWDNSSLKTRLAEAEKKIAEYEAAMPANPAVFPPE